MKNGVSGGDIYANDLTWREQDVLILLAERLSNREISERLHLAESTVKDYVGNILSKLYVKNRREAVEQAKTLGLLDHASKPVTVSQTNLPPEKTPFVGRREELTVIKQQLRETHLLSLIGPGGIGKSRLALKAAQETVDDFADGVFFVRLAPIGTVKDIVQTIAETLKFPIATGEDPQIQLLRYLRRRKLLLVLDNFEHLLDGVGIVDEILQAAPDSHILATSRERLNLQSEAIIHVGGMDFPDQMILEEMRNYDAITLFVQSASKVRSGFAPSSEELKGIANICQVVGGMPLAIELAAAWLHILNVDEIAEELGKDLDILASEVRDVPTRHRSIRAVFDHSWKLLDQEEREIFKRLSVFRGGFTREAAQQVAGATLQQLAGLVDKSFLSRDQKSGRLEVHELLRQYAQEHLERTPETELSSQEAHASYFAAFMEQRWESLKCSEQMDALVEIETDMENVRGAWRYYLGQMKASQLWKFIYGLFYFHWIRWWNHAGMELFAEAATALQDADDEETMAVRALSMAYQSYFMAWLDLAESGYEIAEESVKILEKLDHPKSLVFALECLGVNAYFLYRYTEEIEAMNKMFTVASTLDDKWLLAFASFGRSMAAMVEDDYAGAKKFAEMNLNLYEEVGDVIGSTTPLIVLGHAALGLGELDEAWEYYLRCLKIAHETSFHYAIQTTTKYLGKVALSLGKLTEAEKYLIESLKISKEIGFVRDIVNLIYEFARLQTARGNPEKAVELISLVIEHPVSELYRMLDGRIRDSAKRLLATLEADISADEYLKALQRGQELDLDDVVAKLVELKF